MGACNYFETVGVLYSMFSLINKKSVPNASREHTVLFSDAVQLHGQSDTTRLRRWWRRRIEHFSPPATADGDDKTGQLVLKKMRMPATQTARKRTASALAPLAAAPHTSILSPVPSCKAHAVKIIVAGCASCAHRGRPTGATRRYRPQIISKHH